MQPMLVVVDDDGGAPATNACAQKRAKRNSHDELTDSNSLPLTVVLHYNLYTK